MYLTKSLNSKLLNGALLTDRFSTLQKLFAVLLGVAILSASSYIKVPMYPVPMTMQTAAIVLLAALYGFSLGTLTVASWLTMALLGAPLLAGGAGIAYFVGPTGGYLLGFVAAAAFVGWFSDRGWNGNAPLRAMIIMFVGSQLILALGWVWLSSLVGATQAWQLGVQPFIIGDVVKTLLSAAILAGVHKLYTKRML